ncbi:MAG: GAF domain-containing protein, partial [Sneathiella sp.]|nr:GAF domain-containing protein [Sneathiella sp.]
MSVISVKVLQRENDARTSLLLVTDKPTIAHHLRHSLTGSEISINEASVTDHNHLLQTASIVDFLVLYVGTQELDLSISTVMSVRRQFSDLKIIVIDAVATPERAVIAMKAGASDYLPHRGDMDEFVTIVESACLNPQSAQKDASKHLTGKSDPNFDRSLNDKIRKLAAAAGFLATCRSLEEVCESLLKSLGEALEATGGSLYLTEGHELRRVHSLDPGHAPTIISLPLEKGTIFEQVYSKGEPVLITGEREIQNHKLSGWAGYEANNLFVYPLLQKNGEPIGILSLHGKRDVDITQEDRDLVLILAS